MSRREWSVQVFGFGKWRQLFTERQAWAEGYIAHHRDAHGPKIAMRIIDAHGQVRAEVEAVEDVSIGMIAGWPTAEQYELAAERALAKARAIRAAEQREAERIAVARGEPS